MIQLFIDGREVDIDRTTAFPVTKQFEDLANPTVIKNGFTKTVKLPATGKNNEVFGHIYRLDQVNLTFDQLERVAFILAWNGNLLESGYVKLGEIRYVGDLPDSYEITMYGGLFDFLYELSEKTLDELGKEDPAFRSNYSHQITANAVVRSWENEYYKYILSYSGDYDNFDKGATIGSVVTFPMEGMAYHANARKFIGVGENISYISEDGLNWEKHTHSLNLTNCKAYGGHVYSILEARYANTYYASTDGITWNTNTFRTYYTFERLKNSHGNLYACGTINSQPVALTMQGHDEFVISATSASGGTYSGAMRSLQWHACPSYYGVIALMNSSVTIGYSEHGRDLDGPFTIMDVQGSDGFLTWPVLRM